MDAYNSAMIGKSMEVLVDGYDEEAEQYFGRTYADSPDIDGRVCFDSKITVHTGSFVSVKITGVCDGDLIGACEER